jgi:hypothetical protein
MLVIREATEADAQLLVAMIREFAEFERQLEHVVITPDDLVRDAIGDRLPRSCVDCGVGRGSSRLRFLFLHLFDVGWPLQPVRRRHLRSGTAPREGNRKGAYEAHGDDREEALLLRNALGGARLEYSCKRVLPFAWRRVTARVVSGALSGDRFKQFAVEAVSGEAQALDASDCTRFPGEETMSAMAILRQLPLTLPSPHIKM